nr:phage-related protein tail component [uncultured Mediterranean phage uvMED]
MEPVRGFGRRGALLPYEVDICETLGLTAEEYIEFFDAAYEYVEKRKKAYELVPEVVNGPVTPILINLVIGVALTAIGALLAPKPKQPDRKQPRNLDIPSETGRSKFTKSANFDGVQQLATLGRTIPLIFANRITTGKGTFGGVRVDTDLVFSQLLTSGKGQVFTGLFVLGLGELDGKPDYDGFAIGDLLLRDFSPWKVQLFFSNKYEKRDGTRVGIKNRIKESDRYSRGKLTLPRDEVSPVPSDAFSIFNRRGNYVEWFSGARTPSSKTRFGAYNPLSNSHVLYVPYELVPRPKEKPRKYAEGKQRKIAQPFARLAGLTAQKGNTLIYTINSGKADEDDYNFEKESVGDVINMQNESRSIADEAIQESEQYLIGKAICTCIRRPSEVWYPECGKPFEYKFRIDEKPAGYDLPVYNSITKDDDDDGAVLPWTGVNLMRVAIGSVTNSRECFITEIGVKSEVWRQMSGAANYAAHPSKNTVKEVVDKRGQVSLGTVTKYTSRFSFFRLEVRPLGSDAWINLNGQIPFVVKGSTPTNIYNTIVIQHEESPVNEFRFVPISGSDFYDAFGRNDAVEVYHLTGAFYERKTFSTIQGGAYQVSYTGIKTQLTTIVSELAEEKVDNPEWIIGGVKEVDTFVPSGPVKSISPTESGPIADGPPSKEVARNPVTRYKTSGPVQTLVKEVEPGELEWMWEGSRVDDGNADNANRITVQEGNLRVRYEKGTKRQEYETPRYRDTSESPKGEITLVTSGSTPETSTMTIQVVSGVTQNPSTGNWDYYWEGSRVGTQPDKDKWLNVNDSLRYKPSIVGGNEVVLEQARTEYVDHPNYTSFFTRRNGELFNGAVKRGSSNFDIVRKGVVIGSGNTYINVDGGRWARENKVRDEQVQNDDFWGPERIVSKRTDIAAKNCVTSGVLRDDKDQYDVYYKGILLAANQANTQAYNDEYKFRDLIIKMDLVHPAVFVGSNNRPVWRLLIWKRTFTVEEWWSITFKRKLVYPLVYEIQKEKKDGGQVGTWEITRSEFETKVEEPVTDVFRRLHSLKDPDNTSARVRVKEYSNGYRNFSEIVDAGDYYKKGDRARVGSNGKDIVTITGIVGEPEVSTDTDTDYDRMQEPGRNHFPLNAISDYFINGTDRSSHENNPEHEICFVNEIVKVPDNEEPQFKELIMCGLKITNSKEWSNLSNLSAYINNGIKVERLHPRGGVFGGTNACSNLFPEITYALLTRPDIGAGSLIGAEAVDREAMVIAAKFCWDNGFHWDGVLAENQNLREFIFQQASYCLLDFTIKGGRFALVPSFPYNPSTGQILKKSKPQYKCLFTDGNIRNMEVTFLSPEEREPFKALVIYRKETENGFPGNESALVMRNGSNGNPKRDDVLETFDLTQFCTSRAHAVLFAKYAVKTRMEVTHGIKFDTTPTSAAGLEPGDYIRVSTTVTHVRRSAAGSIDHEGFIQTATNLRAGNKQIFYWNSTNDEVRVATMEVIEGDVAGGYRTKQSKLFSSVWCEEVNEDKVQAYKVESISFSDDGLISVAGSHVPLTEQGTLAQIDWENRDFTVEYDSGS